jgi:hypothetical protein
MRRTGLRELVVVLFASAILSVAMTYPLAFRLGRVGRVDKPDGMFSIWNVAWVARTLVVDPIHVFDANIFYPHRDTLAYSENNLGAGALAIPVYWATRNPFAAHNFVFLLTFVLSSTGMYYLVRHLTGDRGAASVAAVCYAFCPFVFAHTAHIQLLMTAGLPFSLYAFHRVAERPTLRRGAVLGVAMAAQAVSCGYYGVFVILTVGYAVVIVAVTRQLWRSPAYWRSISAAAAISTLVVLPAFLPYLALHRVEGFGRDLDQARRYSSNWSDYLASSSYAHAWMLPHLPPWVDVTFPGIVATTLGAAGAWIGCRTRRSELTLIYAGLAVLACWASFGPAAFLYTALYKTVPLFAWLRAPARFGLIVVFGLSVLTGVALSALRRRLRYSFAIAVAVAALAAAELVVPSNMSEVLPFEPVYRTLRTLPPAPIIEMPFYYLPEMFTRHTEYMLYSTMHWMPMLNGYSDYIPPDFVEHIMTLAPFPSEPALKLIGPLKVRYAVFHMYGYNQENRQDVMTRLKALEQYFRPIYIDDAAQLYEIIGFPQ